jgi:phosphonate transport system permease protein
MGDRRLQAPDRFRRFSALNFVLLVALGAIILASMGQVAPSPKQLAEGLPDMARLIGRMLPPNTEPDFLARIAARMIETFQIALVGAALGIALVWALLFVASIGLGAVAGTMTIMVDTIGFCGRFFAEAMEDAEKEPQEALAAIGANRPSILIGAILPDIMPSLINSSLFALEKAVRSSVVLGLVGAGGIGQELKVAFDLFQYRSASMIILTIFAIVLVMEVGTDKLRARMQ